MEAGSVDSAAELLPPLTHRHAARPCSALEVIPVILSVTSALDNQHAIGDSMLVGFANGLRPATDGICSKD